MSRLRSLLGLQSRQLVPHIYLRFLHSRLLHSEHWPYLHRSRQGPSQLTFRLLPLLEQPPMQFDQLSTLYFRLSLLLKRLLKPQFWHPTRSMRLLSRFHQLPFSLA